MVFGTELGEQVQVGVGQWVTRYDDGRVVVEDEPLGTVMPALTQATAASSQEQPPPTLQAAKTKRTHALESPVRTWCGRNACDLSAVGFERVHEVDCKRCRAVLRV